MAGAAAPAAANDGSAAAEVLSGQLAGLQLGAAGGAGAAAGSGGAVAGAAAGGGGKAAQRVAGLDAPLAALRELIGWPLLYGAEAAALGVRWPRGLLLHGPPGCGKTALVQQVADEFGASLHVVTASQVFGAYVGESERRLREAFAAAAESAAGSPTGAPAVVFLDELDALAPRRAAGGGGGGGRHEARVVAQLLTLLDGAAGGPGESSGRGGINSTTQGAAGGGGSGRVVVVGATNRPNALDPALRRPGRLDAELAVPVPGAPQRAAILRLHARGLRLAADVDLDAIAAGCHGYSGADLAALAREAAMAALAAAAAAEFGPGGAGGHGGGGGGSGAAGGGDGGDAGVAAGEAAVDEQGLVTAADFAAAARRVGPSIVRGTAVELPPVTWDSIGGYAEVKARLRQAIEWPLTRAAAFKRLGLPPPRGALLHGPPGCGKTALARAAAGGSGATFIPLSCAQLYSMYVGEGEAALRDAFARGRAAAPAIIFLDEADAITPGRSADDSAGGGGGGLGGGGGGGGGGPDVGARLLSTLLTELDGLEAAPGVLLLAATNRPALLDAALLRPGRLDVILYVPPPDEIGRLEALRIHTKSMPLADDVDLAALARDTPGFTGAELASICREAALAALREDIAGATHVAARHFAAARAAAAPALTAAQLAQYEAWGARFRR